MKGDLHDQQGTLWWATVMKRIWCSGGGGPKAETVKLSVEHPRDNLGSVD